MTDLDALLRAGLAEAISEYFDEEILAGRITFDDDDTDFYRETP